MRWIGGGSVAGLVVNNVCRWRSLLWRLWKRTVLIAESQDGRQKVGEP